MLLVCAKSQEKSCFAQAVYGQSGMQLLTRRLLACAGFRPLYKVLRRDMNSRETLFAGLAGLRGSVSLILAQAVITEDKGGDSTSQVGNTILEKEKGGKTIPEREKGEKRGKRRGKEGERRMQMFTHTCTHRYIHMEM